MNENSNEMKKYREIYKQLDDVNGKKNCEYFQRTSLIGNET